MNKKTLPTLIAGLAVVATASTSASAAVKLDDDGKVNLFGDVRFRWEYDDRTTSSDANQSRSRLRFRARTGVKYQANDHWGGEIRLSTGNNGNSPYITFNSGSPGSSTNITFDRANIAWTPIDDLTIKGGRMALNFWQQNEQWWDEDRNPDAVALIYNIAGFTLNGAYAVLIDGVDGSWGEDITAAFYQGLYKGKAGDVGYTAALGGASISNANLYPDVGGGSTGLQSDSHWIGSLQAKGKKWLLGADVIQGDANVEDTAVVGQGRIKFGDGWQFRLYYYKVEAFSTLGDGIYSQDNWPNPGNNGVTNFEGIRYQLDWKIAKATSMDLRYYDGERIKDRATILATNPTASDALLNDKDRNRLQLNLTVKF